MDLYNKMELLFKENRFMYEIERKKAIENLIDSYEDEALRMKLRQSQKNWDHLLDHAGCDHNRFVLIQMLFWDMVYDSWLPAIRKLTGN